MSKTRILIVNNNMNIGGVQRALINLLKCIHDKYEITLLLFSATGELMNEIPDEVQVQVVRSPYKYIGMTRHDVQGKALRKLMRTMYGGIARVFGRKTSIAFMAPFQKRIKGYDVAISYLHNAGDKMFYGGCNDFVLKHVDAPRKYAFLHCDYMRCGANTRQNAAQYRKFDMVAACSEGCMNAFLSALPDMRNKTMAVKNCQDYNEIRNAAEKDNVKLPKERINILSVARLQHEKGISRAIEAIAALDDIVIPYHYHIVGDGSKRQEIELLINKYGLGNRVTLLGEKSNPYGYMKSADLLLLPSLSEAAPMVIGEAACLGTPVLTTETTSAIDMVKATGYGWVCENSVSGITEKLKYILSDTEIMNERSSFLRTCRFDNADAEAQFSKLIDGRI